MDMYETSDDAFDTISFSDLLIYSDGSCSSKEEQDHETSFSSFRFKIVTSPPPNEIVIFGTLISVPENYLKPHHKPHKTSKLKKKSIEEGWHWLCGSFGSKIAELASVMSPVRRFGRGYLLFGKGGSPVRMEMSDLQRRKARAKLPRYVLVNDSDLEKVMVTRRSGNWSRNLFGECFPSV